MELFVLIIFSSLFVGLAIVAKDSIKHGNLKA